MWVDGCDILEDRLTRQIDAQKKETLANLNVPDDLLRIHTITELAYLFFPTDEKKDRLSRERLGKISKREGELSDLALRNLNEVSLLSPFRKEKERLLKELFSHKLSGYYFLPRIYTDEIESGYVVLLREVKNISSSVATCVAGGMSRPTNTLVSGLAFDADEFAMPISELQPPFVEHLLQSFSMLYGRIGVPDFAESQIETLTRSLLGSNEVKINEDVNS